jgi:DNA-binding MarR family transcriptional regulator
MSKAHLNRQESFGYLVNHLARLLARALHQKIAPHGVVPGEFPVLLSLWGQDGLTQTELHRLTDVEQATMANTLQRMERDGLVRRVPHPSDRRQAIVRLTPKARGLEPTLVRSAREVNDTTLTGLSGSERSELITRLRQAIGNLQRLLDQPPERPARGNREPSGRRSQPVKAARRGAHGDSRSANRHITPG